MRIAASVRVRSARIAASVSLKQNGTWRRVRPGQFVAIARIAAYVRFLHPDTLRCVRPGQFAAIARIAASVSLKQNGT